MSRRRTSKRKRHSVSKRSQGKAVIRIRSVLGSSVFNAAREIYGEKKINDLAEVLARKLDKEKQKALRKSRRGDPYNSLSETDKKRHKVVKEINFRRGPEVRFFRRKDGKFDKIVGHRKVATVSEKAKRNFERSRPYQKLVRLVRGTLDLSTKQARNLIKDVAGQSQNALRKFKKTKKYKSMSKRRKRRYNLERTRISALIRLQFALTGTSDPVGFHYQREESDEDEG